MTLSALINDKQYSERLTAQREIMLVLFPLPCLQRQRPGGEGPCSVEESREMGNETEAGLLLKEVTV